MVEQSALGQFERSLDFAHRTELLRAQFVVVVVEQVIDGEVPGDVALGIRRQAVQMAECGVHHLVGEQSGHLVGRESLDEVRVVADAYAVGAGRGDRGILDAFHLQEQRSEERMIQHDRGDRLIDHLRGLRAGISRGHPDVSWPTW